MKPPRKSPRPKNGPTRVEKPCSQREGWLRDLQVSLMPRENRCCPSVPGSSPPLQELLLLNLDALKRESPDQCSRDRNETHGSESPVPTLLLGARTHGLQSPTDT